ncbi:MAG TPA: hypothetical protein DET40_21695 [Lentisphaeria bacterium]|nr:hypothetical protein [Lentisphaeria bacterium]
MAIDALLVERPDSPQIRKDQGRQEVIRSYAYGNDEVPAMPVIGEFITGSGYVANYDVKHGPGYTTLTVQFLDRLDTPAVVIHANNTTQYDLSINFIEKALETKVDPSSGDITYLKKWNFNLYQMVADKDASVTSPPAWFDTAHDESDADGCNYAWAKIRPGDPKEGVWKLCGSMTKPGVEAYLIAQPVITAKGYFTTRNDAIAFLSTAIGLHDPAYRFGFAASSGSVYRWLAFPMGITSDGKMWIAQNQYQFADKWDTDLYTVIA